jgi:hypothetical protein
MSVDVERHYKDYVSTVGDPNYSQACRSGVGSVWGKSTNAVYAVVLDDDTLFRCSYHICFGWLNELNCKTDEKPVAVFVQLQTPLCEDVNFNADMQHTYYEWLFNYSPYRSCFITKDHRKAIADRVVVLDANAEANLMIGACSAIRCPWEYYYADYNIPSIARLWYELVADGNDPTAAMALASNFSGSDDQWNTRATTAGHQFLKVDSDNTILNFIDETHVVTDSFSDIRKIVDYYSVTGIWSKKSHPNKAVFGGNVSGWLKQRIIGVSGKAINPFSVDTTSQHYKLPALKEGLSVAIKELKAS